MNISTQSISDPHPVETGWVDEALAGVYATGEPLGTLVGSPVDGGDGLLVAGWPDAGPGPYRLVEARSGPGTGPARYMQVVAFAGPRTAEWATAEEFAATHRLGPVTKQVGGLVAVLRARAADNATLVVVLAESAEAIDAQVEAVMATTLLPGEDPALLTGPDRIARYRLVHADLPVDVEGSVR
jgi:hypothetical protein